jgi:hypothetical protein
LVFGMYEGFLLGVLFLDQYRPHSGSAKFLIGWDRDAKGGEESVMYLGMHLTSFPPRHGIRMRGGERGLVGVLPRRGKFKDVLPPSLEGLAFRQVLLKVSSIPRFPSPGLVNGLAFAPRVSV